MSKQYTLSLPLSPDATLVNYVGEAQLKLAHLHSWNVIWGDAGSGRSHLLQALCHGDSDLVDQPEKIYLGELGRLEPEILKNLESYALVCLDDVDQVFCDAAWEEALFHMLNSCKDSGTKVVLATSRPIVHLPIELADLKSRLSSALAIETDRLSDKDRIRVMQLRARHWGFDLPHEVGEFILKRSSRNMTQLIDRLKQLELETLRAQRKVTIPFAKQTLQL